MLALDIGLKAALVADNGAGGVNALATGGIHQLDAPQGTTPPYVTFREASDFPLYSFNNTLQADHFFYVILGVAVDANESGVVTSAKIADRLKTLLTNPTLTVSGKTVLSCRFDRSFLPLKERDETNQRFIYSRGILAELWVT